MAPDYGQALRWEKVITKELSGATRCMELSKELGRPARVPSIFINGMLAFEYIPSIEELRKYLDRLLND
ncbi:MAG: hypothetical protein WHX93_17705 [bacterium]